MNSPLETLVRGDQNSRQKIPLGLKLSMCVSTNTIHFWIVGEASKFLSLLGPKCKYRNIPS